MKKYKILLFSPDLGAHQTKKIKTGFLAAGNVESVEVSGFKRRYESDIPKEYKLVEEGEIEDNGAFVPYQLFSDGLTTFRVYKNAKISVVIPALTNGTISILRKSSGDYEYAVVGEIPILFAESVLSDLPR